MSETSIEIENCLNLTQILTFIPLPTQRPLWVDTRPLRNNHQFTQRYSKVVSLRGGDDR